MDISSRNQRETEQFELQPKYNCFCGFRTLRCRYRALQVKFCEKHGTQSGCIGIVDWLDNYFTYLELETQ